MTSNEYIRPPGTYYDIVSHPMNVNSAIEIAIVQEHRFAFFYWLKWRNKSELSTPPSLISLDWHRDLGHPCATECEWLKKLDTNDYKEVSYFCWDKLHPLNDGHILAAAYLNIIGDIHVLQKQAGVSVEDFKDLTGKNHVVHCYQSIDELIEGVSSQKHSSVIFDVDLDYFTESSDRNGGGKNVKLVTAEEIRGCLNPHGKLMSWVFPRIHGMTIATEPEFCGGLLNSNIQFGVLHDTLFNPPLLGHGTAGWKHQT